MLVGGCFLCICNMYIVEEARIRAEREEQERVERERKQKEVERLELKVRA